MEPVCVMLAGIGGYGRIHVNGLLSETGKKRVRIVGAVDPYPAGEGYARLMGEGIPVYASIPELYAHHSPSLAIICSPTPFHAEQAIYCLEHGSHVLVEKPIAPTVMAAEAMARARDAAGRQLVVGYQWCFDDTLCKLKEEVRAGRYGAPKALRAIVLWPRDEAYYKRGIGWAGRRFTADGRAVFDNVASNATAHYLMNMLWIAGYGDNGTGIAKVFACAARANDIETFDSICLKAELTNGASIAFAASHAIARSESLEPMFSYTFEQAEASYSAQGQRGGQLHMKTADGRAWDLGSVAAGESSLRKVWKTLDIIEGRIPNLCTAELAMGHTNIMEMIDRKIGRQIKDFPPERICLDGALRFVPGLPDTLHQFYQSMVLPDTL